MKNILTVLFTSIFILSCTLNDKSIESKISAEVQNTSELNLSIYNDFDWDALIILSPYTTIEKIEKQKEIDLSNVSNSIERLDHINLLVFLKKGKAVKYSELKRSIINFDTSKEIIKKENANFKLTSDLEDNRHKVLKVK